jgi:hypothetical protein
VEKFHAHVAGVVHQVLPATNPLSFRLVNGTTSMSQLVLVDISHYVICMSFHIELLFCKCFVETYKGLRESGYEEGEYHRTSVYPALGHHF